MDPSVIIHDTLKAFLITATATSPAQGRVYGRVPANVTFPFVHIADDQVLNDEETGEGWNDVTSTIHVFSRSADKREVKMIAGAIRSALAAGFNMSGLRIAEGPFTDVTYTTDPDGLTEHAIIRAQYKVIPTA